MNKTEIMVGDIVTPKYVLHIPAEQVKWVHPTGEWLAFVSKPTTDDICRCDHYVKVQ